MTTIRFSELPEIITPGANSVFAVGDIDTGESKKITFADLSSAIVDANMFSDNVAEIIEALNGDANTGSDLRAEFLFHDSAYRPGSFYLNYDNFTNTPTIPTDLGDLSNSTGFLRFDNNQISYIPTVGGRINMVTTYVGEGTNLYYTNQRVEDFFDENFGTYYTQFSTTFDEGNVTDSFTDTEGVFNSIQGSGEELQSSVIRISDADRLNAYSPGQTLRIYGASQNLSGKLESPGTSFSVTAVNFPTSGTLFEFGYRIAEFDYATGEISPAADAQVVQIAIPNELPNGTSIYQAFNQTYFIRVNFSSTSDSRGILVYRNTPLDNTDYKLVSVLGPKEVSSGIWIDYYNVDYNPWTGKNVDNTYADIVHFPLLAPSGARRGWVDRTIDSVTTIGATAIDVTLNETVFINTTAQCTVAHNDTDTIQGAINQNSNSGLKTVSMNAKQYVASHLVLPDNFGLTGVANITRIKRLPWSTTQQTSNFVRTSSSQNAPNISIAGIDFDGNSLNSYLYGDTINIETNYAINLGNNPIDPLMDKVRIIKPIGGGIYAPGQRNLRLTNSEIVDSGLSDRLANLYSPLIATNGTNLFITGTRFENFTNYIDASITNRGIISTNIIVNCGSGLFVYGASFVSSGDNVIIGPANEFISTPDTLNSEYDSVNISLENAYLSSGEYVSSNYKYQENGLDFNLTGNTAIDRARGGSENANFANILYQTYYVQDVNGVEEIYQDNTGIILNNRSGLDPSLGEFGFTIDSGTVADISIAGGQYSYSTLVANNANHAGIVYTISFEREVRAATISDTGLAGGQSDGADTIQIITSTLDYLAVGSEVRVQNAVGTISIPGTIGTVTAINGSIVSIRWPGSSLNPASETLTGGSINIIDRFVMAKGRIL